MIHLFLMLFSLGLLANVLEAPLPKVDFNQNPNHLIWKEMQTPHFHIIFPEEVSNEAQRVAHILELSYPLVTRSWKTESKKIPILLQNQSTVSNGFVTLAPYRSEFYLTPAVDPQLSNTEWLKTLAIHEFRHVVQMDKANQNFNKVYEVILGEYGRALGVGITMPRWLLEGDAVGIETALTDGGRGRQPQFERDLKALLLSGRDISYDQSHMGSYKFFVPNHYVYGYFLTSFMREKHGDFFLSDVIDEATRSSYNPLTFYRSYERLSGKKFEDFYSEMLRELISSWKEKEAQLNLTPYEVVSLKIEKERTNYLYPQAIAEGKFIAFKKGMSHIPQFVALNNKKEKTLFYPGPMSHEYPYKLRNGRLAYIEFEYDPRWGYRDYSRIQVYDFEKKSHIAHIPKTKARLAVLDEKGESILYVDWGVDQRQRILIKNLEGKTLFQLQYPKERVITSLDWHGSDQIIYIVKDENDQKSIRRYDIPSATEEILLEPSFVNLGFVTVDDDHILVESPVSGIDNIYLLDNGKLKQLTSSRFGAYAPTLWKNKIYYNDYAAEGMFIAEKKLDWNTEQVSHDSFVARYESLVKFEIKKFENSELMNSDFEIKNHSQFKNSINFHSWQILAPPLTSSVSLAAHSQDLLNKFTLDVGTSFDLNEKTLQGFVSSAWSHYYPVIDLRAAYGGRRQEYKTSLGETEDKWEEGTLESGLQIPWKLVSGRFLHQLKLRGFAKLIKVTNHEKASSKDLANSELLSPGAEFNFSSMSRMALRDYYPEWGLSLFSKLEEGKSIAGEDKSGRFFHFDTRFYLPGLDLHHSFYHQLALERQKGGNYEYASYTLRPRGTESFYLDDLNKYSANYTLPVWYPDLSLGPYLYFNRIGLNLFYDQMQGSLNSFDYEAKSTGIELLIDTNIVRFFVPISWGVRSNFVLEGFGQKQSFDIFLTTIGGYF